MRLTDVICVERNKGLHSLSNLIVQAEVPDAQPLLIKPIVVGELSAAVGHIRNYSFPSSAVVIIYLGTDCSQLSKANQANSMGTARRGLHLAPSNSIWLAEQIIASVAGRIAANKLIVLQEMVLAANQVDEQELDAHFGQGIQVKADYFGQHLGSVRNRKFRASPRPQDPNLLMAQEHVRKELYSEPGGDEKPFPDKIVWPVCQGYQQDYLAIIHC